MSDDRLWEDGQASIFRPSYSATSLFCAGSLIPSMTAEDTAGIEAAVGTVFHNLIAEWQLNGRPDYLLGQKVTVADFQIEIDDEMFVHADECLRRFGDFPGDRFVETRVNISSLTPIPNQSGTADLAICQIGDLDIIDWKYGTGVQVFAEKNTQLQCYAWGFFEEFDLIYDFQKIRLWIAQPRLDHFDVWEITRDQLFEFADFARRRWNAAWQPNADRTPSPKACQWCKVRLRCAALEAVRQSIADATFEPLDEITVSHEDQKAVAVLPPQAPRLEPPVNLSTKQLARIYSFRKIMESHFKDIGEELIARGFQGDDLDGMWKVAEGRSKRKWRDEEDAANGLRRLGLDDDEIYQRKLVSPNHGEKLLRTVGVRGKLAKAYIGTLAERPPGRPTLVPIGDNRTEVASIVDDTFDAADDDDEAAI